MREDEEILDLVMYSDKLFLEDQQKHETETRLEIIKSIGGDKHKYERAREVVKALGIPEKYIERAIKELHPSPEAIKAVRQEHDIEIGTLGIMRAFQESVIRLMTSVQKKLKRIPGAPEVEIVIPQDKGGIMEIQLVLKVSRFTKLRRRFSTNPSPRPESEVILSAYLNTISSRPRAEVSFGTRSALMLANPHLDQLKKNFCFPSYPLSFQSDFHELPELDSLPEFKDL